MSDPEYTFKDMKEAFDAGFDVSGEGWNGEYVGPTAMSKLEDKLWENFNRYMRQRCE